MEDIREHPEWRLLQVFLSAKCQGVYEIYGRIGIDGGDLYCTCPGFSRRRRCKHVNFVSRRIHESGGQYMVVVKLNAVMSRYDIREIARDPVAFREWVIQNAAVEVL